MFLLRLSPGLQPRAVTDVLVAKVKESGLEMVRWFARGAAAEMMLTCIWTHLQKVTASGMLVNLSQSR